MKKILVGVICAVVIFSSFASFKDTSAQTSSANQAQINALLAIVVQLQQQLAALLAGQNNSCVVLNRTLYIGLNDGATAGEVSKLQRFLKLQGDYTYPTITGLFGGATQQAVQKFQARNGVVSGGSPASTGFGVVGALTRAKIQTVSCGPTVPVPPVPPPALLLSAQCSDTIDNDADGKIDYPNDPGCSSTSDDSESDVIKKCSNGIDDDGDGKIDYPADPGCTSPNDNNENDTSFQCNDGVDNDGDQVIDYPYEPGCTSATDNSESNEPLFLIQNDYSSAVWNIANSLGGERSWLIGGDFGNANGTVNLEELRRLIEGQAGYEKVPNGFSGYVVLDIEEPFFAWLRESPSSAHFQTAQSEMVKALNYAKQLRPNAKFGYYGIPLFPIHFAGGSWADATESGRATEVEKVFAPSTLLNAVDFYAPSIYSPYPNASTPSYLVEKEKARNKWSVLKSKEHSNGKPVFTYISDRFWNSSPVYNYLLMPFNEFKDKQFIGMQNGADGVFLWGGDHYWYNLGYVYDPSILPSYALVSRAQIRSAFDIEIPVGMDGHTYIDQMQERTLRIVASKLFGTSYTPVVISGPSDGMGGDNSGGGNTNNPPAPYCGDGTINNSEQCDGSNLAGATCTTQGFVGGTLSCSPSCTFVTSACTSGTINTDGDRKVSFFPAMWAQLANAFTAFWGLFFQ